MYNSFFQRNDAMKRLSKFFSHKKTVDKPSKIDEHFIPVFGLVLEKYINLWSPVNIVTKEEVEEMLEKRLKNAGSKK